MLILNKKRILIITMCLVLSFFFTDIKKENKTVETVALPVENKVIIIDARTWLSRPAGLQVMRKLQKQV